MIKSKTKKMLALLAVGAVMTTAAAGVAMSRNFSSAAAFADSETEDVVTAVPGSEESPVTAIEGENTIEKMIVKENPEASVKELVYYMTFTPAKTGLYSFAQSDYNVVVGEIYSETDLPYGDWNENMTVYTVELTENIPYTVLVINYDWEIDLTGYEVGSEYKLPVAATITIGYKGVAAGRTWQNAIPYNVGDSIIVQGNKDVWYSFTGVADTEYYFISMQGTASVYYVTRGTIVLMAEATNGYKTISRASTLYIHVTPSEDSFVEVQVLEESKQTAGSCIVTAEAIPENGVVGGGKWYKHTVGESEESVSLSPIDNAPVIVTEYKDEEGNVMFTDTYTIVGSVKVYDGYNFLDLLFDGSTITLEAEKTYYFFAPDDVYQQWNEEGEVVKEYDVQSKLVIG